MEALPANLLRDVAQEALGVAVIGIDEGQFVSWPGLAFCLGTPSLSHFLLCWFCLLVSNVNLLQLVSECPWILHTAFQVLRDLFYLL